MHRLFPCRLCNSYPSSDWRLMLTRENSRVVTEAGSELRSRRPHGRCTFCLARPAKPLRVGGQEWSGSGSKMNAWAVNLVPALLRVPCSRLLVCKHCSGRPTFKDHSLAIFKGCPTGYNCHCRGLSDSRLGRHGRPDNRYNWTLQGNTIFCSLCNIQLFFFTLH